MAGKSIIIIGAGLAGLSAGCYAQMNGYRSRIFERHAKPGGVAAAWKRRDYLIDGGIHFIMGHRPGQPLYDLYRELGVARDGSFIDMTTYARFLDEAGGYKVDITGDLDRLASDLKTLSPADTHIVDDLIDAARAVQDTEFFAMMGKPPELTGPLDKLKQFRGMRRIFKYLTGKYARSMADYAQNARDPVLRQVLANLFLPEAPVWFVFMLLALLANRQMGLLGGGCLDFVLPIEQRYKNPGGQVTYKSTVEEILVENNRAVGVRLTDGSAHRAGIVVSAADGYSTIFNLLGGRYVDEKTKERYRNWKLIRPAVMVSFGLYGRPVGNAGRRCPSMSLFGPAGGTNSLPPG